MWLSGKILSHFYLKGEGEVEDEVTVRQDLRTSQGTHPPAVFLQGTVLDPEVSQLGKPLWV